MRAPELVVGGIVAASLLCAACTNPRDAEQPAAARTIDWPRPGDHWLAALEQVRIARWPASNLPDDLQELVRRPFRARSDVVAAEAWTPALNPPRELAALVRRDVPMRCYEAHPRVARAVATETPIVRIDGAIVPPPTEASIAAADPGAPIVWWDETDERLLALGREPPACAAVEYTADPRNALGRFEPLVGRDDASALRPAELVRRVDLAYVSRDALLVPAGGSLALTIERLQVDTLRVAFAVRDFALAREGDVVVPRRRASDGAIGAVDVIAKGARQRLWSAAITPADLDRKWIEASVDLSRFVGQTIDLELVTEPGPHGDARFDYGLFADLRFEGAPRRAPARPDVVLIDLDTLRANALSLYGNPRPTSPGLDAWARARAVVYTDVRAAASWTLPSTASILSGTWVEQHGIVNAALAAARSVPMVASLLRDAGYETVARVDGGFVSSSFGFSEGFDRFEAAASTEPALRMQWEPTLERLRTRRSERPLFLFLHTYATHEPYLPDDRFESPEAPYRGPLAGKELGQEAIRAASSGEQELAPDDLAYARRLYDAGVARMDAKLATALRTIEQSLAGREVLVIVTSDHGEEFGEHGVLGHGKNLYDTVLRVPLVIAYPRSLGMAAPRACDDEVSSIDLAPTILAAAGLAVPRYMPGRVLFRPHESSWPRLAVHGGPFASLQHSGFHLIRRLDEGEPVHELYELAADPLELNDLALEQPARVQSMARMLELLEAQLAPIPENAARRGDVDEETIGALRELGYVH